MKKTLLALAAILAATSICAQDAEKALPLDEKTEKLVRMSIPYCADMKISRAELGAKLPARMTGALIRVEAPRAACNAQYLMAVAPSGDFYLGLPWVLGDDVQGANLAEKLKNFAWTRMQENFIPTIDRERTRNGLLRVTMMEMTERGNIPIEGELDQDGKVFFVGHFHPADLDFGAARIKAFEPQLATSPAKGGAKPDVTIVEFSDFECPSCKRASGYVDPIVEKHGDRVRYIRYDVPLVTMHPWALPAAVAGRAIYRQKPDVFWLYKKQIYENQDKLTAFTLDEFARGFAADHDLDMKRYDADIASSEIREELLKGVGAAFSNDVRATPTYMINGTYVDPGDDGKALDTYVDNLLKK